MTALSAQRSFHGTSSTGTFITAQHNIMMSNVKSQSDVKAKLNSYNPHIPTAKGTPKAMGGKQAISKKFFYRDSNFALEDRVAS